MPLPKRHKDQLQQLDLRLFVAGSGARSLRTIDSVKRACEKHAPGRYVLSIVDVYLHPEDALKNQVVAVPTLIRRYPEPIRMFVGEIRTPAVLDPHFAGLSNAPKF